MKDMKKKNLKMNIIKKGMALFLAMTLFLLQGITVLADAQESSSKETLQALAESNDSSLDKLMDDESLIVAGDSVSDWIGFLYGRLGMGGDAQTYLNRLEEYVSQSYQKMGGLDTTMATPWHRAILTVLALGGDPTSFGEDAEGNPINLVADGTYNFIMADSFDLQGLNAWIFALLALDSRDYEVPDGALYTREDIITALLSAQEEDGGFGLTKGASDVDITAMVLQALAPYKDSTDSYELEDGSSANVKETVEKALNWLSENQLDDGGYESYETENSESASQVIIALSALGVDADTDERFVKDKSLKEAFDSFRTSDGMYCHVLEDGGNMMATQQAIMAELAMERLETGEGSIYSFSDQEIAEAQENAQSSSTGNYLPIIVVGVVILLVIVILVIIIRKKKEKELEQL